MSEFRSTTILGLIHNKKSVIIGDGQVTFGDTVMKSTAKKIRKIYDNKILTGFAGATADAMTLFEYFEEYIESCNGNLKKASVELSKAWRTDKMLRRLEAMLIVMDKKEIYILSGSGDVITPDDNVIAIGSGAPYAVSAARVLMKHTKLSASKIAEIAMEEAAKTCIFTNNSFVKEEL